jgi:Polyketide cyclase / dehydrase and lipid transport
MALVSKTNFKAILLTTTLVGLFSASAIALEAKVEKSVAASAEKVWVAVGDFCGIASWHPAVAKCVLSEKDGKSFRELTLKDGARLLERLEAIDKTAMSYTYSIVEGPLPVKNYTSTLSVKADGTNSKLSWVGTFEANGKPDADVINLIAGIYDGGTTELAKTK